MAQPNVFISCKESLIENNRSFYGCFNLGPFDSSESLTVANALRRTLLSECPGLGIVSVMIENVNHEYSTILGMRESVLDLVLNLKEIVLKKKKVNSLYKKKSMIYNQIGASYFKPVSGFLKVKGPGVIRAKDLKLPPSLECIDPEQYIATLAEDGILSMKFIVMEGKGYLLPSVNPFDSIQKSNNTNEVTRNSASGGNIKQNQKGKQNNLFIDNNLVQNRLNFLKDIKNSLSTSSSATLTNVESNFKEKNKTVIELASLSNVNLPNSVAKVQQQMLKDQDPKDKGTKSEKLEEIKNSTSLNLDTIFNPITKVSYMIEDFDNKIVEDLNDKANFVNDISNLIDSSQHLKKNLPFLTQEIFLDQNQNEISKLVDTYSISEIKKLSSSLHPLKKHNSLHNVVLEIWTNGSIHPRDALYIAFDKLSSAFLNMKKTQSYSSMYVNESALLMTVQKSLTNEATQSFVNSQEQNLIYKNTNSNALQNNEQVNINEWYFEDLNKDPIEFLNLALRPYTLLKRSNIHTISDLSKLTINDLNYICGFNPKYVSNIINSLSFFTQPKRGRT